jgi:hypothetical protein
VQEWRTQFHPLKSVDLRYQHQVIVNPDEVSASAPPVAEKSEGSAVPAVARNKKSVAHHKAKSRN